MTCIPLLSNLGMALVPQHMASMPLKIRSCRGQGGRALKIMKFDAWCVSQVNEPFYALNFRTHLIHPKQVLHLPLGAHVQGKAAITRNQHLSNGSQLSNTYEWGINYCATIVTHFKSVSTYSLNF